jgi:hypothetical protein
MIQWLSFQFKPSNTSSILNVITYIIKCYWLTNEFLFIWHQYSFFCWILKHLHCIQQDVGSKPEKHRQSLRWHRRSIVRCYWVIMSASWSSNWKFLCPCSSSPAQIPLTLHLSVLCKTPRMHAYLLIYTRSVVMNSWSWLSFTSYLP